jgi:predicted permease
MAVEGHEEPRAGEENIVQVRAVTPDLMQALGVPVMRGRGLATADGPESPPVAVLTEAAAQRFFPGEDAVGRRVSLTGPNDRQWVEVVGIVGDVRDSDLTQQVQPGIYLPHTQRPSRQMSLVLRTGTDPMRLVPAVRREVQGLDPDLPIFNARTLEQMVGESVSQPRFYMLLLAIFAATALALSAVGIFGVMSYMVAQRTREIGIRMALGAAPRAVLRMVVGGAVVLALLGVGLGLVGALAGSRLLAALLFGVSPTDPTTLASVAAILTGVAIAASYLPARRAVRVDPMVALRGE